MASSTLSQMPVLTTVSEEMHERVSDPLDDKDLNYQNAERKSMNNIVSKRNSGLFG